LNIWRAAKGKEKDALLWGDEVRYPLGGFVGFKGRGADFDRWSTWSSHTITRTAMHVCPFDRMRFSKNSPMMKNYKRQVVPFPVYNTP
jgi:hypothetical protein